MFPATFGAFFGFIVLLWLVGIASLALWVAALISVSNSPIEAFGPWWDNTRQTWLIGIALGFVVPFGTLITAILWFAGGRPPLRHGGQAGRPFWAGAPKPPPGASPPGWGGYPPAYPPGYASAYPPTYAPPPQPPAPPPPSA